MKYMNLISCFSAVLLLCAVLAGCSDNDATYMSMNVPEKSLQVEDSYLFSVKLQNGSDPVSAKVTWSIIEQKDANGNDASVATIDANGKVTGVTPGTAKVKAETEGGRYALAYLTVVKRQAPSGGMAFSKTEVYTSIDNTKPDTLELLVDSNISKHFEIKVTSDSDKIITPTLIRKDAGTYKVVLGLGGHEGTATLTASVSSYKVTAKVHVGAKLYLSFDQVSTALGEPVLNTLSSFTFNVGTENVIPIHFLCIPNDEEHLKNLNFYVSTSGTSIFKGISQRTEGNVLYLTVSVGQEKGDGNIVIESMGNKVTAQCTVMDKNDVGVVSCTFAERTLTTTLKSLSLYEKVKIKPIAAAALWPAVWTSSDVAIATVTEAGVVSFHRHGTVTITATAKDKSDQCRITAQLVASDVTLTESTQKLTAGETSQWAARATTNYDDQAGLRWEWNSSNEAVATVSAGGLVTAKATGVTTITAVVTDDQGNMRRTERELTVTDAAQVKIYNLNFGSGTFQYDVNGSYVEVYDPKASNQNQYYSFLLRTLAGQVLSLKAGTYAVGAQIATDSYVVFNEFGSERAFLQSGTITINQSGAITFDLSAKEGAKTITIKGTAIRGN